MGTTNLDAVALKTPIQSIETIRFFSAGAQTVGVKKSGVIFGYAGVIRDIRGYIDTAPVGANLILEVKKNGTTIFTTSAHRPTATDGFNSVSAFVPDVTAVAVGDRITYDVVQVGSGTAGSDLYLAITLQCVCLNT